MLSSVFINRPRLAIVIAIVITLAGLIAVTRIPVAQFPDIVPPQVSVTATYPGASAETVEAAIAQPIEAQVNGVDDMIYMSSTSGNNGTYTLTVTFKVGSDPNLNTVNVQNRVRLAEANLPQEVTRLGVTVKKQSSSFLQIITLFRQTAAMTNCFSTITASSMWWTGWRAFQVWDRRSPSAPSTTVCASGSTRMR